MPQHQDLDNALTKISKKEYLSGKEVDTIGATILQKLVSDGFVETNNEDGVWKKIHITPSGRHHIANGGYTEAEKRKLSLDRQDEFLDFQRKFMEEQHRHNVEQGNKMLWVSAMSMFAALLSAFATIATTVYTCSANKPEKHTNTHYDNSQYHENHSPCKCYECPFRN